MQWLGTSELVGLPGLPGSIKGIIKKAQRENWEWRDRQKSGGGKEYRISSLPIETQQYLAAQSAPVAILLHTDDTSLLDDEVQDFAPEPDLEEELFEIPSILEIELFRSHNSIAPISPINLKSTNSDRAKANLALQLAFDDFLRDCCNPAGISKVDCEYRFCECYKRREIVFSSEVDVYRLFPKISRSKLCRDRKLLQESGTQALAGNYGHRKGQGTIEQMPEMQAVILGLIMRPAVQIHQELISRYADDAPSLPTVTRWVREWKAKNIQIWTLLKDKNAFNSRFRAAHGDADAGIDRVNQRWEMDATRGDIFLSDGKRYCLLRVIDVYSRRIKTHVSPTVSSQDYMRGLLYKAFLDWGVPEELRTDRGMAETSGLMAMALADLEIYHHVCMVRSPWEKPFVERSLNTRSLLSQLPGFSGANVLEQQQIRQRQQPEDIELRLTPEQLQAAIDQWTLKYENRVHGGFQGTSREGMTPIEAWASSPGVVRRIETERDKQALTLLLSEVPHGGGIRTIQKKGISIGRYWYADSEGEWTAYIGHQVMCKFSPCGDAGIVHCFGFEDGKLGHFLFTATNADLLGENRAEKAQKAKQKQQAIKKSASELQKLAKTIASELTAPQEQGIAEVIPFPLPSQDFRTTALDVAAAAVEASMPQQPKPMTNEEQEAIAAERERLERRERQLKVLEDPGDRYRRLWFALKGGGDLCDDDLAFMARFEQRGEGRVLKRTLESNISL